MTTPLHALPVAVSPLLAGSKWAVLWQGRLEVSPAMMDLIRRAETPEELERILGAIGLINLDALGVPAGMICADGSHYVNLLNLQTW